HRMQPGLKELPSYQHMLISLISGAMGPFSNAPIDTIKTHVSSPVPATKGASAFERIVSIACAMWRKEGFRLFYKGITPRVLRVAPGQVIVFAFYEWVSRIM
ncbi:mitochondrial carrier domain-containing protein, partial [Mycena albidolilacea]